MKRMYKITTFLCVLIAMSSFSAFAASKCISSDAALKKLNTAYPGIKAEIVDVREVPDFQLCQYILQFPDGRVPAYVSDDFCIVGGVLYDKNSKPVASKALDEMQKMTATNIKSLKKNAAYKIGTGKKEIVIVTDPECPSCKVLMDNITGKDLESEFTFYLVLFPLQQHVIGREIMLENICNEKAKVLPITAKMLAAYSKLELAGHPGKTSECAIAVNLMKETAKTLAANKDRISVPMIIFPNGKYQYGALNADQIRDNGK